MSQPLSIAFIWHMHQPYYRDLLTGHCHMPWVRLHGTKDYLDMVKILERFPSIHQTFNLVPSLVDQIEAYLPPVNQSDEFLDLSRKPTDELSDEDKRQILRWFFMANPDRMIKPFARYHDLLVKRGVVIREEDWSLLLKRFRPQDYLDLQVWFNLVWIDPWLRSQEPRLAELEAKGNHFTEEEKHEVLDHHLAILARILPAYRQAHERGQVELSTSPYYHPIVPLLCDLRSAHVALPHLPLPELTFRHPDDARRQLARAIERHEQAFGHKPQGVWPPEGSVSEDLVNLALEAGIGWMATDEAILWRTLKAPRSPSLLYRPHLIRRKTGHIVVLFRDRELSDLIGFVYSHWNAALAVQDFLKRLEGIHQQFRTEALPPLVSVILDGENAWEFYARDGHDFLQGLYEALAHDARFRLVSVSEFLAQYPLDRMSTLPSLSAGSWIDGNFATWIGHPEKNSAWTHLARTRDELMGWQHAVQPSGQEALRLAWRCLDIAEGSDWMWWYGDTHFSAQSEEFDRLFRAHLGNVYRAMGREAAASLTIPIKPKTVQPLYEPTASIHPVIDGLDTSYYEWLYAGRLDLRTHSATMQRGDQALLALRYGVNALNVYFRVDLDQTQLIQRDAWDLILEFVDRHLQIEIQYGLTTPIAARLSSSEADRLPCAYQRILELAVPKTKLPFKPGEDIRLVLSLRQGEELLERYPAQGAFQLRLPAEDFEAQVWSV